MQTNLKNVLKELTVYLYKDRQEFFITLINERLDKSIKSYYDTLTYSFNSIMNGVYSGHSTRVMNKLNKGDD